MPVLTVEEELAWFESLDKARVERARPVERETIHVYRDGHASVGSDEVVGEEPVEIRVRLVHDGQLVTFPVAVTMRTPGQDFDLAVGFLFSEGVVRSADEIERVTYCTTGAEAQQFNIVNVDLRAGAEFDPARLSRHVYTTSSCGICGKASLDLVRASCPRRPHGDLVLTPETLFAIRSTLDESQPIFARTGGLHASLLFDRTGKLVLRREDVGRHNATDKVLGALVLERRVPASDHIILFSGRSAFELVQKAVVAGIPVMLSVGAPTSLAVALAREQGATLVGFLGRDRFNVYCGAERIRL